MVTLSLPLRFLLQFMLDEEDLLIRFAKALKADRARRGVQPQHHLPAGFQAARPAAPFVRR